MMSPSDVPPSDRHTAPPQDGAILAYDGACPFCSRYVALLRLRAAVGPVQLVDMRQGGPIIDDLRARGLDLDQGMVLIYGGTYAHGAECIHRLAMLTSPSNLFNRMNAMIFRSPLLSRVLYPVLRQGRNAALVLLQRPQLRQEPEQPK